MKRFMIAGLTGLTAIGLTTVGAWAQTGMEPPGPPGSAEAMMKPLNQIDPGEPILSIPCVLTNSGAYYLISNLVGKASNDGIRISANDVRVNLRGFALIGVTGSWDGIWATAAYTGITVENGSCRGWGWSGISLENAAGIEIRSIKTSGNQHYGIYAGENADLRDCLAWGNTRHGFLIEANGSAGNCSARGNGLDGINVGDGGRVLGCTVSENTGSGISVSNYGTIRDCTAAKNRKDGVRAVGRSRIADNNSSGNGDGSDTGAGIHLTGSGSRVQDNNVTGNDYGIWTENNTTNLIIRNSASGNSINEYQMGEGTILGNILRDLQGEFSIGGPWVNFEF